MTWPDFSSVEPSLVESTMHPLFEKADRLTNTAIGAAIEVHREMGPGLLESIYERCLTPELKLRGVATLKQQAVSIRYKDVCFEEELRLTSSPTTVS